MCWSWSSPARIELLPDRFFVIAYPREGDPVTALGSVIRTPLVASPDPNASPEQQLKQVDDQLKQMLAAMLDRYYLCYGDKAPGFVKEFHPLLKQCTVWTVNLRPAYPLGDRIIAMPTGNEGTEWFEAPEPGWAGMTAHVGGLHLAQLRIAAHGYSIKKAR